MLSEVTRVQSLGRVPTRDMRYVDIYREKPIKVSVKVRVPVREHPKVTYTKQTMTYMYSEVLLLLEFNLTVAKRNSVTVK